MKKAAKDLSLIMCLILTIVLTSCAGSRTQESSGGYTDDTAITTKVKSEFSADQELNGLAIKVETSKGVVRLSGLVDTKEQVQKAMEVARSVEGVVSVKNSLIVKGVY